MEKRSKYIYFVLLGFIAPLFLSSFKSDEVKLPPKSYIDEVYFSKLLFEEVNKARETKGLKKLKWDETCSITALDQAKYCAQKGKLQHKQNVEGKEDVKKRHLFYNGDASVVGENLLTLGFRIPNYKEGDPITPRIEKRYLNAAKFMVKLWLKSPPHKKNMLYADYTKAGIGMVYTRNLEVYVGQVFSN